MAAVAVADWKKPYRKKQKQVKESEGCSWDSFRVQKKSR